MNNINKSLELFLLTIFLFLFVSCYSQETPSIPKWFEPTIGSSHSVFEEDKEILNYNFSEIINDKRCEFIGYIGDNYQKMCMHFDKVEKESNTTYRVIGYSVVKSNKCSFSGYIQIIDIRELNEYEYGVDDFMKGQVKRQGICIARYNFEQDNTQENSGIFSGILLLRWYIDNKLNYDDINDDSDNYSNNQFLGIWSSYSTNEKKKCAWGQYRIPDCGDLDIGAAEFSVNPVYASNGWDIDSSNNCSKISSSWYGDYSVEIDLPHSNLKENTEAYIVTYAIIYQPDECKYYKMQLNSNDIFDCEVMTTTTDSISFRAIGDFTPNTEGKPLVTLYKKDDKFYISGPFIFDSNYKTDTLIEIEKIK